VVIRSSRSGPGLAVAVSVSSDGENQKSLRSPMVPELGRIPLKELTPVQVQHLLNRKSKSGLAHRTLGHIRAVLRDALNRALR
jgi:hypothetical protein